jgi:hypothetical protein
MAFLTNLLALASLLNNILNLLEKAYEGGASAWIASQNAKAAELAGQLKDAKTTEDKYAVAARINGFFS